jgi:TRAP-type uncharacterized transport system substrate-binding protein
MRRYATALTMILLALVVGSLTAGGQQNAPVRETGIDIKKPLLGAACKVCPWGALGDILKTAMAPYGYDVKVCYNCSMADAPRIVGDRRTPPPLSSYRGFVPLEMMPPAPNAPVDFGVTSVPNVLSAYRGVGGYAADGPRRQLRLIANIQSPSYIIVAVRTELGITDLSQLKEKRWPVRMLTGGEANAILAYYGLTPQMIEAAGGHVGPGNNPAERTDYDVIIAGGSLGNAPEYNVWYEASQRHDLTYLQLPEELLAKLAKDNDMEFGTIPLGLLRGVDRPIRTVVRTGTAIYGRADMPEAFAYVVAKAIDEQQDLLQWSHLNFSYNWRTVWKAEDLPLHAGAARFYREVHYMKQR